MCIFCDGAGSGESAGSVRGRGLAEGVSDDSANEKGTDSYVHAAGLLVREEFLLGT